MYDKNFTLRRLYDYYKDTHLTTAIKWIKKIKLRGSDNERFINSSIQFLIKILNFILKRTSYTLFVWIENIF